MFNRTEPYINTVINSLGVKARQFADDMIKFVTVRSFMLQFFIERKNTV